MTKEQAEHLIEVRAGEGQPAVMRARPGEEIGPISVGTGGAWRLSAEGVADKHAYLFFDGQHLFLQSVSLDTPALIDGRPVSLDWTQIEPPCEISFGAAKLWYGSYEDQVKLGDTVDKPIEKKREMMNVASLAEDDDGSEDGAVTELAPIEQRIKRGVPMAPPIPAAGSRPYMGPGPGPAAGAPPNRAPAMAGSGSVAPATRPLASPPGPPPMGPPGSIPAAPPLGPYPHASTSGSFPQVNASGAYPHANASGAYPHANASGAYPQATTSGAYPQTMASGPQQRATTSGAYPQATASGAFAQVSAADAAVRISGAPPLAQTAVLSSGQNPLLQSAPPMRTATPLGTAPIGTPWMAPTISNAPGGFGTSEMMGEGATTPIGMTPKGNEKGGWGSMSFAKKATVILFLPMVASVLVIFFDIPGIPGLGKRQPTAMTTTAPTGAQPQPDPVATASPSVAVVPGEVRSDPQPALKATASGAPAVLPSASPSVAGLVKDPASPPLEDDPVANRAKQTVRDEPKIAPGSRTLQREAADAVAAGAYDRAAKLYEKLAAQHPDQPAFAEAAAITRAKAAADRK
jgi:hypothetical protein